MRNINHIIILTIVLLISPGVIAGENEENNISDQLTIKPKDFEIINITTSWGNVLNLSITFLKKGVLNLYIVEGDEINSTNPLNYTSAKFEKSRIIDDFEIKMNIMDETKYQIIIRNLGINELTILVDYEILIISYDYAGPWDFLIVLCVVLIVGIYFLYKFRELITTEKILFNRPLMKLIEMNKIDNNRATEIIEGLNKSAEKEGYKLTLKLTQITDRISKRLEKDK